MDNKSLLVFQIFSISLIIIVIIIIFHQLSLMEVWCIFDSWLIKPELTASMEIPDSFFCLFVCFPVKTHNSWNDIWHMSHLCLDPDDCCLRLLYIFMYSCFHILMLRSRHVVFIVIPRWQYVTFNSVHVLGLGIIRFYCDSQQNEPATV